MRIPLATISACENLYARSKENQITTTKQKHMNTRIAKKIPVSEPFQFSETSKWLWGTDNVQSGHVTDENSLYRVVDCAICSGPPHTCAVGEKWNFSVVKVKVTTIC